MISINKDWFPTGKSANNFGWDPLTKEHSRTDIWPRIHLGDDWWPEDGDCFKHPFKAIVTGPVEFIRDDGSVGHYSILIQYVGSIEVRYYHVRYDELTDEIKNALKAKTIVQAGTVIGPCGDVGLGTGRHVHIDMRAYPGTDLMSLLGEGWDKDKKAELSELYGMVFVQKTIERCIVWMNENVIFRHTGNGDGPLVYCINPELLLK
jgi:murein DD-endopeptidase MepM/ murein hydrolase activator NlpD